MWQRLIDNPIELARWELASKAGDSPRLTWTRLWTKKITLIVAQHLQMATINRSCSSDWREKNWIAQNLLSAGGDFFRPFFSNEVRSQAWSWTENLNGILASYELYACYQVLSSNSSCFKWIHKTDVNKKNCTYNSIISLHKTACNCACIIYKIIISTSTIRLRIVNMLSVTFTEEDK